MLYWHWTRSRWLEGEATLLYNSIEPLLMWNLGVDMNWKWLAINVTKGLGSPGWGMLFTIQLWYCTYCDSAACDKVVYTLAMWWLYQANCVMSGNGSQGTPIVTSMSLENTFKYCQHFPVGSEYWSRHPWEVSPRLSCYQLGFINIQQLSDLSY